MVFYTPRDKDLILKTKIIIDISLNGSTPFLCLKRESQFLSSKKQTNKQTHTHTYIQITTKKKQKQMQKQTEKE